MLRRGHLNMRINYFSILNNDYGRDQPSFRRAVAGELWPTILHPAVAGLWTAGRLERVPPNLRP